MFRRCKDSGELHIRRECGVQAFCRRQNLGGGGIHFRRAFQSPKGGAPPCGAEPKKKDTTKVVSFFLEKVSRFDRNWSGGCKLQRGFKVNDREYRLSRILSQIASDFGDEPLSALVVQFFPCACKFYKRLFVLRKIGSHTHERLLCYHYRDAFTV